MLNSKIVRSFTIKAAWYEVRMHYYAKVLHLAPNSILNSEITSTTLASRRLLSVADASTRSWIRHLFERKVNDALFDQYQYRPQLCMTSWS